MIGKIMKNKLIIKSLQKLIVLWQTYCSLLFQIAYQNCNVHSLLSIVVQLLLFLHNCARTCDITSKIFKGIGSTLWKVLFVLFMAFCGFELVNCVLCIVGCVHCFGAPFQAYQGGSTWVDSFHKMVLEPSCDFEGKISDILGKMFKH